MLSNKRNTKVANKAGCKVQALPLSAKPSGGYRLLRSRPPREGMVKPDLWKGLLLMLFPRLSFNGCRRITNKAERQRTKEKQNRCNVVYHPLNNRQTSIIACGKR